MSHAYLPCEFLGGHSGRSAMKHRVNLAYAKRLDLLKNRAITHGNLLSSFGEVAEQTDRHTSRWTMLYVEILGRVIEIELAYTRIIVLKRT